MKIFLLVLASTLPVWGQQTVDNSAAAVVIPWTIRTTFPGTCRYGQKITMSNESLGSNTYTCGSSNDWNLDSSEGGGGSPDGSAGCVQLSNVTAFLCDPAFRDVGGVITIGDNATTTSQLFQNITGTIDMDNDSPGEIELFDDRFLLNALSGQGTIDASTSILIIAGTFLQITSGSGASIDMDNSLPGTLLLSDINAVMISGITGTIDADNTTPGTLAMTDNLLAYGTRGTTNQLFQTVNTTIDMENDSTGEIEVRGQSAFLAGATGQVNVDAGTPGVLAINDSTMTISSSGAALNMSSCASLGATGLVDIDCISSGTAQLSDTNVLMAGGTGFVAIDQTPTFISMSDSTITMAGSNGSISIDSTANTTSIDDANLDFVGASFFATLTTTGSATGKNVVCADSSTGQIFLSSTSTGCLN